VSRICLSIDGGGVPLKDHNGDWLKKFKGEAEALRKSRCFGNPVEGGRLFTKEGVPRPSVRGEKGGTSFAKRIVRSQNCMKKGRASFWRRGGTPSSNVKGEGSYSILRRRLTKKKARAVFEKRKGGDRQCREKCSFRRCEAVACGWEDTGKRGGARISPPRIGFAGGEGGGGRRGNPQQEDKEGERRGKEGSGWREATQAFVVIRRKKKDSFQGRSKESSRIMLIDCFLSKEKRERRWGTGRGFEQRKGLSYSKKREKRQSADREETVKKACLFSERDHPEFASFMQGYLYHPERGGTYEALISCKGRKKEGNERETQFSASGGKKRPYSCRPASTEKEEERKVESATSERRKGRKKICQPSRDT